MAKNYSAATLDCLIWDRMPFDGEAGDENSSSEQPSLCKYLDGRQKHAPHRPESLNVSHFNMLGLPSPGTTEFESPSQRGRRNIRTVKEVMIKENLAELEALEKNEPIWKKRALGEQILGGEQSQRGNAAPAKNMKRKCPGWEWQNREFNLHHPHGAASSQRGSEMQQQALCTTKEAKERRARRELKKHLNTVSKFKAVNRLHTRTVITEPLTKHILSLKPHHPAMATRAKSPQFSPRVRRETTNCCEIRGTEVNTTSGGHYHLPRRVPLNFSVPSQKDLKHQQIMAYRRAVSYNNAGGGINSSHSPLAVPPPGVPDGPAPLVFGTVDQIRHVLQQTNGLSRRVQSAKGARPQPPPPCSPITPGISSPIKTRQQQRPASCRVRERIAML